MKKFITLILMFILIVSLKSTAQTYAWNQKASFGGGFRAGTTTFSIGNKGYITCGLDNALNSYNDLWEYDATNNAWTQKASIPGLNRYSASGFSLNNKGYVCLGWEAIASTPNQLNDLWEYDPANNSWLQKSNFPGAGRYNAAVFTIGNKAYLGLGYKPLMSDFYEYDANNNSWTMLSNPYPGAARVNASGFSITYTNGTVYTKGYVSCGSLNASATSLANDLWEFTPGSTAGSGTWASKANLPGNPRYEAFAFSINEKGYLGGGANATSGYNDFYEYNPINNTWIAKPLFPGINNIGGKTFTIGNIAYQATGQNISGTFYDIFWEYAPVSGINNYINNFSINMIPENDHSVKLILSKPQDNDCNLKIIDLTGKIVFEGIIKSNTIESVFTIYNTSDEVLLYSLTSSKGVLKSGKFILK